MVDRSSKGQGSFRRAFYEGPRVACRNDIETLQNNLGIQVEDDPTKSCPPPIDSFEELGVLPEFALQGLRDQNILKPMPIQAQALPLILSGQDVIGLAQTGSGKTLSFLLPAVTHMEAQETVLRGEVTPIVLVLAPTRELAVQIAEEAEKILWHSKAGKHRDGLFAVCLYGGGDKRDQKEKLRRGCQVVVATPGRLLDFVESKVVSLRRVTYFVLDEADRMLDLGFLGDVTSISSHIRPDRQVLFFSATWGQAVSELALGLCDPQGNGPVRISCGQAHAGASDDAAKHQARKGIEQRVIVVADTGDWKQREAQKKTFLERHITSALESSDDHKVLVFVSQKQMADELAKTLWQDGFAADSMHGGKNQETRLWVLDQFRKGELRLLVCTDVLGRGIDLPNVSHVVIFEMGAIEDYIHRIGRTGRGLYGKGQALVFFEYWDQQPDLASELIEVLVASDQVVPQELKQIASEVASGIRGRHNGGNSWGKSAGGWGSQSKWDGGKHVNDWQSGYGGTGASDAQRRSVASKADATGPTQQQAKVKEVSAKAAVAKVQEPEEVPDSWDD